MNSNIIHRFILPITLLGLISAQTVALNDKTITILKDEVVLEVRGLVCSFCAVGLQGGLSSLKYVDKKNITMVFLLMLSINMLSLRKRVTRISILMKP